MTQIKQLKRQIVGVQFKNSNGIYDAQSKTYYYNDLCECKVGDEAIVEVRRSTSLVQRCEVLVVSIVKDVNITPEKYILCKIESTYTKARYDYQNISQKIEGDIYVLDDLISNIDLEIIAQALLNDSRIDKDTQDKIAALVNKIQDNKVIKGILEDKIGGKL